MKNKRKMVLLNSTIVSLSVPSLILTSCVTDDNSNYRTVDPLINISSNL